MREVAIRFAGVPLKISIGTPARQVMLSRPPAPSWNLVRAEAAFPPRDSARVFRHGGQVHIANGFDVGDVEINDIWRSVDGINFTLVNDDPPYQSRSHMAALNGVIYAWGNNTVAPPIRMWKSLDGGENWTLLAAAVPFRTGVDNPAWIVNGKLQCFHTGPAIGGGGIYQFDPVAETWSLLSSPAFCERILPTIHPWNGDLYSYGGSDPDTPNDPPEFSYTGYTTFNDLWRSTDDGLTWTQIVAEMPCAPRMWPSLIDFENRLYLVGGFDNANTTPQNFTDTWGSGDGLAWTQFQTLPSYIERHAAVAYVQDDQMFLAAGKANLDPRTLNDIWQFVL